MATPTRHHARRDRHCPQCGQTDADQWLARLWKPRWVVHSQPAGSGELALR